VTADGLPDVKWISPDGPSYVLPPMPDPQDELRQKRANTFVVTALSLACTAFGVFDLILFAAKA